MQVWEDHGKGVHYYMSEIKNSTGKNEVKAPKAPKEPKVQMWIEKHVVPVLKVIAANKFLRSLMEGFYAILPIIIFSSIDGIIMWVPPAFANNPNIVSCCSSSSVKHTLPIYNGILGIVIHNGDCLPNGW
jgi:hypothetical protein